MNINYRTWDTWAKAIFFAGIALVALLLFLTIAGIIVSAGLHEWNGQSVPLLAWPSHAFFPTGEPNEHRWVVLGALAPSALFALLFIKVVSSDDGLRGREMFGSAREAREADIKKAGLRGGDGLMIGWTGSVSKKYGEIRKVVDGVKIPYIWRPGHLNNKNILMYRGNEHLVLYAPTRSGKGVALCVPGLLTFSGSTVTLDIKGENYRLTSGYRKAQGQPVYVFNPFAQDGKTHCWNPLSYVRVGTHYLIDDLSRIAMFLFPIPEKGNPFYPESARQAFIGVGSFLAETPSLPFTIAEIYRQLTKPNVKEYLTEQQTKRKDGDMALSDATKAALNDFLSAAPETMQNIASTLKSKMGMYLNPILDAATSKNDFDFRELRKKRMSIYFCVTPDNLERAEPITNLFFQQCLDANMGELPEDNPALKYQVGFFLDEFTSIGRINILHKSAAFVAGYGLRLFFIIQSLTQLDDVYGVPSRKTLLDNCGVEMIFTPKHEAAKELSDRTGYLTAKSISKSKTMGKPGGETESKQKRALFLPQELEQLDMNKLIIFRTPSPVIIANKVRYYAEADLRARLLPAVPVPTIEIPGEKPVDKKRVDGLEAQLQEIRARQEEALKEAEAFREELRNRDKQVVATVEAATVPELVNAGTAPAATAADVTVPAVLHTHAKAIAGLRAGTIPATAAGLGAAGVLTKRRDYSAQVTQAIAAFASAAPPRTRVVGLASSGIKAQHALAGPAASNDASEAAAPVTNPSPMQSGEPELATDDAFEGDAA